MGNGNYKYDEQEQGIAGEYENQHWLDNWLRLKVQQEQKEFNNLTREEAKKNVRSLTFVQLGLKGKIVIENFPDLTQLNLSNNDLEEIIVHNCPDLKLVSLAHNQLTKLKIENCPSVKELYTSYNQLTSLEEVKIEELNNLRILSYDHNPLTVEEKDRLDALGLKDTAAKARVNGPAQEWLDAKYPLEERSKIEKLDISGLGLQGDLDLEGFTNLKSLDCSGNELTDLYLNECEKLEYLDCSNNELWELDVINNKYLKEISACHNEISQTNFTGLDKLHTLMLTSNRLRKINLSGLTNLLHLNIALNSLEGLNLKENLKLKHLYLYENTDITELEVKHLTDLESLYCYKIPIRELDCSNLKKLKELYCANTFALKKLSVDGCVSLKDLDCAENPFLKSLAISNLPLLDSISVKESGLEDLKINNCPNLEFLDFSKQFFVKSFCLKNKTLSLIMIPHELTIDEITTNNLRELYYTKNLAKGVPSWQTMPKLEVVGIGEDRLVKDKDGKDVMVYFVEETDVLAQRNTSQVIKILTNPKNYSFADIFNLKGKQLHGVSTELREKLIELATKKANEEIRKKFTPFELPNDESEDSGDEENPNSTPPTEEPSETNTPRCPTPQEAPTPKDNDKDQIISDLQETISQLQAEVSRLEGKNNTPDNQKKVEEIKKEIKKTKEKIIKSGLDENKKKELLKILEKLLSDQNKTTDNSAESPSPSHNYNLVWIPVLIGQATLLSALIYAYWCDWKKRKYK